MNKTKGKGMILLWHDRGNAEERFATDYMVKRRILCSPFSISPGNRTILTNVIDFFYSFLEWNKKIRGVFGASDVTLYKYNAALKDEDLKRIFEQNYNRWCFKRYDRSKQNQNLYNEAPF